MVGVTLAIPFMITPVLCMEDDGPSKGYIISTMFFVSGIVTLLQSTFGCMYCFHILYFYFYINNFSFIITTYVYHNVDIFILIRRGCQLFKVDHSHSLLQRLL